MKNIVKKIAVIGLVGIFLSGCTPEEKENTPTLNTTDDKKINEVVTYSNVEKKATVLKNATNETFSYGDISFTLKNTTEEQTVTESNLKDLMQYKFVLEATEGKYTITFNYYGILLEDLINLYKIENYNNVLFKTSNGSTLLVPVSDASDALIVFGANGKSLREWGPIKVIIPTYDNSTWLENVNYIEFK